MRWTGRASCVRCARSSSPFGEGSERKGILGTPERVADACACLFAGLGEDPARHLEVGFMEAALAATEVTAQRCTFPE
jgi:GTP cyclohydrolase I